MKEIILNPLKGVYIEGIGEIIFGQNKEIVKEILGKSHEEDSQLYYYDVNLRIDFNEENNVEFIECLSNDKIKPIIYNKEALSLEDKELISLLKFNNKEKIDDNESEYAYYFHEISTGIYRESTPNSVIEMSEDMKNDGTYDTNKEWIEEEYKKCKFFTTIGIGEKDYYNK